MKTVITMVFLSWAMYVGAQPITSTTTYKDWFDAGKMKLSVGKYTLAINDFNKSLALNPSAAEAYLQRGIAKMKNGDNENAATDFTQVIRLQAGSAEAYAYRGQIKQLKGDFQGAMYDINKAIASNSANADYYIFRSQVSDKMGLTVQAEADRQEAAKMGGSKVAATIAPSAPAKTEQPKQVVKETAKEMVVKTETAPAATTPQLVTVKTIPTETPKQVKAADALPEVADVTTASDNETTPPTRRRRMDDDQALQPKNDRVQTAEELRTQKIDIAKKENAAKAAAIQQKKTNLTIEEKAGKNEAPKAVIPPKEVKVTPKVETPKVEAPKAVEKMAEKVEIPKKEVPKVVEKAVEKVAEIAAPPAKKEVVAAVTPKAVEKMVEKVAPPVKVVETPKPAEDKTILASVEVEYLGSTSYTEGGGAAATKGSSPSGRQGEETKKAETPQQKPKAAAFTPQPAKSDKQPDTKSAEAAKSGDAAKAKVEQLGVSPSAKPIEEVAKTNGSSAPQKASEADIKRSLFNEARRRATADNHKGALEELDKLIAMDDKNAAAYLNRAISRNQILDFHGALEDVDKAIALSPNMPEAHYNKANIYFDLQQFKDAINSYTTAVEMKKDYVAAYLNRALAKRALGGEYNPCDDWYQAKELGSVKGRKMFESLCGDYEVTTSVTAKKTDK